MDGLVVFVVRDDDSSLNTQSIRSQITLPFDLVSRPECLGFGEFPDGHVNNVFLPSSQFTKSEPQENHKDVHRTSVQFRDPSSTQS
jgi:hypothetical protein